MKVQRHGQAAILSQSNIERLFIEGLTNERDRALRKQKYITADQLRALVQSTWL